VESFQIDGPYTLRVQFDDGTEQLIDFQPILAGELFSPLRDLAVFEQVRIDPEVRTLVWPNGADFDPATLHDWPQHVSALTDRAQRWELTIPYSEEELARRRAQSGGCSLEEIWKRLGRT
jgi:hypothetical protein